MKKKWIQTFNHAKLASMDAFSADTRIHFGSISGAKLLFISAENDFFLACVTELDNQKKKSASDSGILHSLEKITPNEPADNQINAHLEKNEKQALWKNSKRVSVGSKIVFRVYQLRVSIYMFFFSRCTCLFCREKFSRFSRA